MGVVRVKAEHPQNGPKRTSFEGPIIRRVLFASFACYLDDANGAAIACRAMMEALARRGFSVEVLSGPVLERAVEVDLASWLAARGLPFDVQGGNSWGDFLRRRDNRGEIH